MSESSEEKTEDPTDKKFKDSAEEGQSFKFKELLYLCNVLFVILSLSAIDIVNIVDTAIESVSNMDSLVRYLDLVYDDIMVAIFVPVAVSIFSVALPSLMQTKFVIAVKAMKIDFAKLNPVQGVKNLFSMKTIIELFKSMVVHIIGGIFITLWFFTFGERVFSYIYLAKGDILSTLYDDTVLFILLAMMLIFLATTPFIFFERVQFVKDLKMTKEEVKREQKDQNGNPQIKGKRQEFHRSLINESDTSDVKRSSVILANPTHLAVGIYFDIKEAPIPMVSIKHEDKMAFEVFRVAKENNIPIIRNKKLTRAIYKSTNRYELILDENLIKVLYLLHWLEQIEYQLPMYDERDVDVW